MESVSAETFIPNIIDADVVQAAECDACRDSVGRVSHKTIFDVNVVQADKGLP